VTVGSVSLSGLARIAARRTHDYVRHGTTSLFAALDVATGRSPAAVDANTSPELDLHLGQDLLNINDRAGPCLGYGQVCCSNRTRAAWYCF